MSPKVKIEDYIFFRQAGAKPLSRGSAESAGHDICALLPNGPLYLYPLRTVLIPTGIYGTQPANSVALVCSRSGLASKGIFCPNAPGVIDSDYRGEWKVMLTYIAPEHDAPYIINDGDRVAQILFFKSDALVYPTLKEVATIEELPSSNRGAGGFGSTGK